MKVSLLAGVVLLMLGIGAALMGIFSVGGPPQSALDSTSVQAPASGDMWYVAVPILSGLALALGGLLVGLSMGNWRNPRSHVEPGDEVVDPEGHHKMKHV
jgi:hypothetical protein